MKNTLKGRLLNTELLWDKTKKLPQDDRYTPFPGGWNTSAQDWVEGSNI